MRRQRFMAIAALLSGLPAAPAIAAEQHKANVTTASGDDRKGLRTGLAY